MHSKGIAHLDIKPDNLLLNEDFQIKISDFDTCFDEESDVLVSSPGTEGYRAPEILTKSCSDMKQADTYSLGITLFVFMSGLLPYPEKKNDMTSYTLWKLASGGDSSFFSVHNKITHNDVNYSQEFQDLFFQMIAINPRRRPTLNEVKNHPWMKGPMVDQQDIKNFIKTDQFESHL
jgi:serine/threonine protein kinase